MNQKILTAIFALTVIMIVNPAYSCDSTTCIAVENDLRLNICAEYRGVGYGFALNFFPDPAGFYWKADIATFKQLSSADKSCIHVEDDLALKICCLTLSGVNYKLTLNYSPMSKDPSGYYWKADTASLSSFLSNSLGMIFNPIPAGTFTMGSPATELGRDPDEVQHQVTLTKSFYIQTTEVTQGQWRAVMGSNPSYFSSCGDNCPVEQVSWDDAQAFIVKLNQKGEGTYRLPTEAEWEYAARAGSTTAYSNGNNTYTGCSPVDPNLDKIGWYCGNSDGKNHPVAQKQPNTLGLYDMSGNVREWCQDWYGDYPSQTVSDPTGSASGLYRTVRGGSWWCPGAQYPRSANRGYNSSDARLNYLGFRLVRTN